MQIEKVDENGRPYIEISEGYTVRLEYEEVPEEYKEKARKELRETPEIVEASMKELRELLEADEKLYVPVEHDDFLLKFLRPTKFYAKSAYELMKRYYQFKIKYPKYCHNLLPSTGKLGFEHNIVNFQPKRDQHGRRILLLKGGGDWDPSKVSVVELFRALQLSLEAAMLEPMTQINGCVTIFDMEGLSWTQIMQYTPSFALMFLEWVQECIPLRLKAVHIVNNMYIFNMLFAIFKPFIGAKLRKRIHFHGKNYASLLKHIDPEFLRPRYGGTMPCEDVDGNLVASLLEKSSDEYELANTFGFVDNNNMTKPVIVPVTGEKKPGAKYVIAKDVVEQENN